MNLTKYETARIIGARALQISMGAPFLMKLTEKDLEEMKYSTIEIAKLEFSNDLIPISIKKTQPIAKKKREPLPVPVIIDSDSESEGL